MNQVTINLDADVEDTFLKNEGAWMTKIVDSAHKHDTVKISLSEGVAIEDLGYKGKNFLQILTEVCQENDWPLSKFSFFTVNLTQDRNVWPKIRMTHSTQHLLSLQDYTITEQKRIAKKFGMFIGRSSWERLLLASHLFTRHKDSSIMTYRSHLDRPESMLNIDIDRLMWHLSSSRQIDKSSIDDLSKLISALPLLQSETQNDDTHLQWNTGATNKEIMSWYDSIFCDVVCEKTITGKTFFPTEKISRPLVSKTPFLIMAAPDYIKNLHRLGFRSFGEFWDESYDHQQGVQRVLSMKKIIDDLAKLPINELDAMYKHMLPVLEHNYKTYKELTVAKLGDTFNLDVQ